MWSFFARLFDTSGFPPRWECGVGWSEEPWVGYLHILADVATFLAYYAVPCVVVYFVARHHNVKFPRVFYVFLGLIFFSCGTVHLIEAGIFWWPLYRFSAFAKLLTAAVSCTGVVVLARILPRALELKSGEAYRRAVSGRQEAEESLRASEERFQLCVRGSNDGIWDWDVDSNQVYYSPRFKELLGYKEHEFDDTLDAFREHLHEDDVDPTFAAVDAHLESQAPYDVEYRLRTKSIGYKWFRARGQAIWDEAGQATRMAGSITEITEQKLAAEKLMEARDAAEAASRAKSDFLANMSHEIRTPMNGVIGMTELLSNTKLASDQREYLGIVRDSADSLLHLLNDILDFSKIEAGKLELESIPFNLRDTIGRTAQTLALRAAEKGLELNCRIAPQLPTNLVGDPGRLRQIVVNLVGNAVKFTQRGEVTINVEAMSESADEITLKCSVKDTGVGIPAEKRALIFDAFSQADESTTREYGGTGLGLAICSQLIEMMGGRIWLESEVDQGTTFYFTATFGIGPATNGDKATQLADLAGTRVLVVDDNPTNRRVLEEILESWGLNPVSVADGQSALDELQRAAGGQPYQIVLLDCMMPTMDGFEVAERISSSNDYANTALVMISSADRPGDPDRCRELGIARYLTKPVVQSELFDVLLAAVGVSDADQSSPHSTPSQPDAPKLKVLLVEDGVVNQRVALGFLEMQGHDVIVANNGREAVEAHAREPFDIVLMDVQMPEMDGLEATSIIRNNERKTESRTPIIAMTAAAMKGDREQCLAAGMDAYVAKPIDANDLFETILRHTSHLWPNEGPTPVTDEDTQSPSAAEPPLVASPDEQVFDPVAAEASLPGGRDSAKALVTAFLQESTELIHEMEEALQQNDSSRLRRAAHTLKSSASLFRANRVAEQARELEEQQNIENTDEAVRNLTTEVERLATALREWAQVE